MICNTKRQEPKLTTDSVAPEPMERNFTNVWMKFPMYTSENTLMISNYHNKIDEYHGNDIVLPVFDPRKGKTDMMDDKHLMWLYQYVNFLEGMNAMYTDVKSQTSLISYPFFLKRINKTNRYESNSSFGDASNPEF